MKVLLILLLFAAPVYATQPRAVITGPKEARPGSLVVLDATESQGLGRLWLMAVSPEETSFLAVEGGKNCIFASPTPGVYVFVLVVSGTNPNGGPAADMATHTVTLTGPRPPPGPDPKPEPKPDPDDPAPPPTPGLHVVIVDDENMRGHLPQSQINIFTSIDLANWLKTNTARAADGNPAFRFSSNDSLVQGEQARQMELPVFVGGWDAVMSAVNSGQIRLPAWAISNGNRGVIEALPTSVEAAIRRLEEFR